MVQGAMSLIADDLEDAIHALESGETIEAVIPALRDILTGLRLLGKQPPTGWRGYN